ncbi:unannotated protein [freshwater metagenome]|uniref:Unannotated protein n=1 Tax=freshwater metagenome TaxID=449393 RepID=A0A6J7NNF3_9ZZZZ
MCETLSVTASNCLNYLNLMVGAERLLDHNTFSGGERRGRSVDDQEDSHLGEATVRGSIWIKLDEALGLVSA